MPSDLGWNTNWFPRLALYRCSLHRRRKSFGRCTNRQVVSDVVGAPPHSSTPPSQISGPNQNRFGKVSSLSLRPSSFSSWALPSSKWIDRESSGASSFPKPSMTASRQVPVMPKRTLSPKGEHEAANGLCSCCPSSLLSEKVLKLLSSLEV